MKLEAIGKYLTASEIKLTDLLLDPNNPRFITKKSLTIPDSGASDEVLQKKIADNLLKAHGADKLRLNMEINGYLPIDRIVVRRIDDTQFIVLEGNRRIAAAKSLSEQILSGFNVSVDVKDSLVDIPCLVYTGTDTDASWLFQGLRHISGINDWSSYHKARLLVEQMEEGGLSLTEVGKRFGLTPHGAGQWARGYRAFMQATEETDYTQEINEQIYPYLQELFGRSSIAMKDWLGWSENKQKFENSSNLNEFIGWFYPRGKETEGLPDETPEFGDWEKRRISTRDDLRQLSYLIGNSNANFMRFRSGSADVEGAYNAAIYEEYEKEKKSATSDEIFSQIEKCSDVLLNLPIKIVRDAELKARFDTLIKSLKEAIEFAS